MEMNQFDPKHYRFPRTMREAGMRDSGKLLKDLYGKSKTEDWQFVYDDEAEERRAAKADRLVGLATALVVIGWAAALAWGLL